MKTGGSEDINSTMTEVHLFQTPEKIMMHPIAFKHYQARELFIKCNYINIKGILSSVSSVLVAMVQSSCGMTIPTQADKGKEKREYVLDCITAMDFPTIFKG